MNRLPSAVRHWQFEALRYRQNKGEEGEARCEVCKVGESERQIDIHHINGDPSDNHMENLRLLCHQCNLKALYGTLYPKGDVGASGIVRERESDNGGRVDVSLGAPELRLNRVSEPLWRRLVLEAVLTREVFTTRDAVTEMAERVGRSKTTCQRYLEKIASVAGPLMVVDCPDGRQRLVPRPSFYEVSSGELSRQGLEEAGLRVKAQLLKNREG